MQAMIFEGREPQPHERNWLAELTDSKVTRGKSVILFTEWVNENYNAYTASKNISSIAEMYASAANKLPSNDVVDFSLELLEFTNFDNLGDIMIHAGSEKQFPYIDNIARQTLFDSIENEIIALRVDKARYEQLDDYHCNLIDAGLDLARADLASELLDQQAA
jgi:hypothetical protein